MFETRRPSRHWVCRLVVLLAVVFGLASSVRSEASVSTSIGWSAQHRQPLTASIPTFCPFDSTCTYDASTGTRAAPLQGEKTPASGKVRTGETSVQHGALDPRSTATTRHRFVATKPGARFTVDAEGVLTDAMGASSKGLVGTQYEDFLGTNLGGRTNVSYGGRQFDVEVPGSNGVGPTLIEAKSGNYWDIINSDPQLMLKFKNQAGSGAAIARQQGSQYLIYSNTPIPPAIQSWLTGKGIGFRIF